MLVAIGVVALVIAAQSGTQVNAAGREVTQATYLAQEIREWTLKLPFSDQDDGDKDNPPGPDGTNPQVLVDDLDDLMNVTYSPPRNANGTAVSDMTDWSQHITLEWKDPDSLTTTVSPGASDVIRVSVAVARRGETILTAAWLVVRRTSE
ncbi:MAG: hypothetical protein AMJ81_07800 [Phycisphaerae bacterium SM23_33]|nr:MAG: hypothetical protein AMJ81_07800 [Phycisphaerae bacterium SM23_33]